MLINYRLASGSDLKRITEIYNEAIEHGGFTADMETFTVSQREKWFSEHDEKKYPVFVYEVDDKIIGYASLSSYRPGRQAVASVAEISIYIDSNYRGKGAGSFILNSLIQEGKQRKLKNLLAIVFESNTASCSLFRKFNFEQWGRLPSVVIQNELITSHLYFGLAI